MVLIGCGACTSAHWGWIQPEVAKTTHVVAVDRAGFGWSEPGPEPRDARSNASELQAALSQAGIPGPYIIVGYSYGGAVARLFAHLYPDEVVGMVLVDPRNPDQSQRLPPELLKRFQSDSQMVPMLGFLSRFGLLRVMGLGEQQAAGLPPRQVAENAAFYNTPKYWASIREEAEAIAQTDEEVRQTRGLGDRPLYILSASEAWFSPGQPADETRIILTQMNEELTALSSNSVHAVVEGASHSSLTNRQEHAQVVTQAILRTVASVRTGKPLSELEDTAP